MLGHDFDSIHIGGIQILKNTALEHPGEYQREVLTLLRAHYLVQKKSMTKDEHKENPSLKQQVLARAISEISSEPADRWWRHPLPWLKNLCKFDPVVARQIKALAAEEDTAVQELVAEALAWLPGKPTKYTLVGFMRTRGDALMHSGGRSRSWPSDSASRAGRSAG